ncbi:MAG: SURF1 family protein [Gammaproteobacteria bacterium]|nr:SURF1 family protein [Gammaproteobacteria bacterium]
MKVLLRVLPWATGLALLVLFVSLGFWQLRRADEKQLELDAFDTATGPALRLDAPSLSDLLTGPPESWMYRHVLVAGEFDRDRQFLLDNRTHDGRAGYHVLSLLDLGGARILVNRGWIPAPADRSVKPQLDPPPSVGTFSGRLWRFPRPGLLLGADGFERSGWPKVVQRLDASEIERALDGSAVLPAQLLLDPELEHGYVRAWQPHQNVTPDRHRAYALQWFTMALALVVIAIVVNRRTRHVQ